VQLKFVFLVSVFYLILQLFSLCGAWSVTGVLMFLIPERPVCQWLPAKPKKINEVGDEEMHVPFCFV
jgi:hypothetical protein